jgi:hypothetical protein
MLGTINGDIVGSVYEWHNNLIFYNRAEDAVYKTLGVE